MAEFSLLQNDGAFGVIWSYKHGDDTIEVKPHAPGTFSYVVINSELYVTERASNLSASEIVSALTTKVGEDPTFVASSIATSPTE